MIQTYGGMRSSLTDADFKYIEDPNRIAWTKSVIPNVQILVDFISTIPYNSFRYDGDIYFKITKIVSKIFATSQEENSCNDTSTITTEGYQRINISDILQNEITQAENKINEFITTKLNEEQRQDTNEISRLLKRNNLLTPDQTRQKYTENIITYNFFGGIVYELLNDRYRNVNLHKYVDPTSDIDILILYNTDTMTCYQKKISTKEYEDRDPNFDPTSEALKYEVQPTLIYQNENGILMINPFTQSIADFIYTHLLDNLNRLNLNFNNSVPFEDVEYYAIAEIARNIDLGYRSTLIGETNARLISYFDENFQTFRIQLVLKMQIGESSIIDHFFEFLIGDKTFNLTDKHFKMMNLSINNNIYQISSLPILMDDNLDAYHKRQNLIIGNLPETRHKGINHTCRIIYLLDLLKKNNNDKNNIFKDAAFHPRDINIIKNSLARGLRYHYNESYIIYYYINRLNIYKKLDTKYIFKAFESVFLDMKLPKSHLAIVEINKIKDPELTEERMYNILSRFFDLNLRSSHIRHFIINSPQIIDLLNIPDDQATNEQVTDIRDNNIDVYRERMNELSNSLKIATTIEERQQIRSQIKQLEEEFQKTIPAISIREGDVLMGGRRNRKSKKKYRNKLRFKKYKNTKKRRKN